MAPRARELTLLLVAVMAFPLAMTITSVTSSDGVPDRSTPWWDRDGSSATRAAHG